MQQLFKIEKNKFILEEFISIVCELNKIGIKPIVYGSLGLYLQTGEKGLIDDIDFVLKNIDFNKKWERINILMSNFGYINDLSHSQEFIGKKPYVSFMTIEQIRKLTPSIKKMMLVELNKAIFLNFQLEDYLKIYQEGLRNKWRKTRKEKDDLFKIDLIKRILAKN